MRKIFEFITSPKRLLIAIYLFLFQYLLLKGKFEIYRFSEQSYIYEYGILISKGLVYLAFILSILYPLILGIKDKKDFKKIIILAIIGFIPALFCIILFTLSN